MKTTAKYLTLFLTVILVLTCFFVASADEDLKGDTFTAETLCKPEKILDTTPNTFEAWVKFPKDMSASTRGGVILGNYGGQNPCINFEVHQNGNPRLYWVEQNGTVHDWRFGGVNVYTGEWEHITIVRDAAALKVYCYINGELKQTMSTKSNPDLTPANPLYLGGDIRSGNGVFFRGELASVAVYSDMRTVDEIKADMTAPAKDSLLLHYDLKDAAGSNRIADLSGNGYDVKKNTFWINNKEEVTDYAYSFMVIGDTQIVADSYPDKFKEIYNYVLDNLEKKNVRFVFGLGDITNRSRKGEWKIAKENIARLNGKVGYSIVRGNHDDTADFKTAFPFSEYESVLGGSYEKNLLNTWQEFSVGNIKYLVLTLDYGAKDGVLEWASGVVEAHPNHNVIVTTHAYLFRDGTTLDKNDVCPPSTSGSAYNNGDELWEKFIKKHKNIVLVLSGHDPCDQIIMTQTPGDNGNIVTQMLVDGQGVDVAQGGVGLVATLYFSEDGKKVTVDYYSTLKKKYFMEENQFSFELAVVEPSVDVDPGDGDNADQGGENNGEGFPLPVVIGAAVAVVAVAAVAVILVAKKKKQAK